MSLQRRFATAGDHWAVWRSRYRVRRFPPTNPIPLGDFRRSPVSSVYPFTLACPRTHSIPSLHNNYGQPFAIRLAVSRLSEPHSSGWSRNTTTQRRVSYLHLLIAKPYPSTTSITTKQNGACVKQGTSTKKGSITVPNSPKNIRITSHGCGGVFRRWAATGVEFLAIQYTRRNSTQWRFPYGRGAMNESPIQTLSRQMANEVAKDKSDFALNLIDKYPIHAELRPDERITGGTHAKIFFLANLIRGECRTCERLDRGRQAWLDETLGPPEWIEVAELLDLMRHTHAPISHQRAAFFGLRTLAQLDSDISSRYEVTLNRGSQIFRQDWSIIEMVCKCRGAFHHSDQISRHP